MDNVKVFLAEGFEEVECLTAVDILRRGGLTVSMVSVTGSLWVTGAHGISIKADVLFENAVNDKADILVLPGGMPGAKHLQEHKKLGALLVSEANKKTLIGAICAAPAVLGRLHLLEGKRACCYPGFEGELLGAEVLKEPVVVDERIITSRGMGTAIAFSLALLKQIKGEAQAKQVADSILYSEGSKTV